MRYVVKATCYWDNRYYKKGETVDLDSAVTPPPPHFELIDKPKKQIVEKPKAEAEKPKQDEPKARMTKAKAKAKRNG